MARIQPKIRKHRVKRLQNNLFALSFCEEVMEFVALCDGMHYNGHRIFFICHKEEKS